MEISNSKKKILIITGGVLLVIAVLPYFFMDPSGREIFPKCPIHETFGIYCSGCGSQRAIHDLLHFRFMEALGHNLLLLPGLLLILVEFGFRFFAPQIKSPFYRKWTPWVVLTIIIVYTVLRNIKAYPFEVLAP